MTKVFSQILAALFATEYAIHLSVLVLALLGCIVAICCAVCWICLFWAATKALLLSSQLLRLVYEVPVQQRSTSRVDAGKAKQNVVASTGELS